jgi:hypothetical protein
MGEPRIVSEILAGAALAGRRTSALGALLGLNTHLIGHSGALLKCLSFQRLAVNPNKLTGQLVFAIR